MQQPKKLPTAGPAEEARAQAEAYDSLFASRPLELDDGAVIQVPPHPDLGMLDDDRMEDYEDLLMEVETYDRKPDVTIPDETLASGVVVPGETIKGDLLRPYRRDGIRVKPAHSIRVVQAALGVDVYQALRDGGRSAADVWKVWGKQGLEVQARQQVDSKSASDAVALDAVAEADSE